MTSSTSSHPTWPYRLLLMASASFLLWAASDQANNSVDAGSRHATGSGGLNGVRFETQPYQALAVLKEVPMDMADWSEWEIVSMSGNLTMTIEVPTGATNFVQLPNGTAIGLSNVFKDVDVGYALRFCTEPASSIKSDIAIVRIVQHVTENRTGTINLGFIDLPQCQTSPHWLEG